VCLVVPHMKNKNTNALSMYEALSLINRSFGQILQELEGLRRLNCFRRPASIKSVELAVNETRAWTLFEILDVLHQYEEDEWTRFGRVRAQREKTEALQTPVTRRRAKLIGSPKKA
jgi:hypothetical protein